jgi:HlyD family secretion protein
MSVSTYPRPRAAARAPWIIAGVVVILVAILAALALVRPSAVSGPATVTAARGSITAGVSGTGTIVAEQSLDLAFVGSGTVAEVLVKEGDLVSAGQPLARLDTRDLELQVASAEASLASAQAQLEQRRSGNATPEQLAAAQASVASAEASLAKARTNNVTAADLAEAEAQLRSARAQLDELRAGPRADELAAAQASYDQAVANLAAQRTSLAVAKERARSEQEQAANSLRDAQDDYSKIYWDNRELERLPGDLAQERIDEEAAAQRAVANAEQTLAQKQLAYEQARADEVSGLQTAESQLREAEVKLRVTREGATPAEIAQAEASVEQARATLDNLRQGGSVPDIAAAQAGLDQARANLAELTASATASDLRIQEAGVAQAEQSLAQAQLQLEQATLRAPFAGVVSAVTIVPGSVVSGGGAVSLIDRDPLSVELKLSENDVAKVALGMPVTLRVEALRGTELAGEVSYVAPASETSGGVVTYAVRVDVADPGEAVKVGMTANLDIVYATSADALLVPSSALLPKGAGYIVQVPAADGGRQEVDVTVGLSDGANVEILSGLSEGQQIIAQPGQSEAPRGGLFGQ